MIIGGLVALAIIAALLIFVVVPAMNPSQPIVTATAQVAAASTTIAPTIEPTQAATSTTQPTVAATVTPVPTEATAEVTEAATEAVVAANLTPTVAFPTGRPLQLLYNDSSFYVFNAGSTLAFSSLKFEALDVDSNPMPFTYDGSRWSTQNPNLTSQGCGALEPVQFLQFLHPSKCKVFNSKRTNLQTSEYFWRTASGGSTFRVLWNDAEVARCPVQAGSNTCDVRIPPV